VPASKPGRVVEELIPADTRRLIAELSPYLKSRDTLCIVVDYAVDDGALRKIFENVPDLQKTSVAVRVGGRATLMEPLCAVREDVLTRLGPGWRMLMDHGAWSALPELAGNDAFQDALFQLCSGEISAREQGVFDPQVWDGKGIPRAAETYHEARSLLIQLQRRHVGGRTREPRPGLLVTRDCKRIDDACARPDPAAPIMRIGKLKAAVLRKNGTVVELAIDARQAKRNGFPNPGARERLIVYIDLAHLQSEFRIEPRGKLQQWFSGLFD
jgi:hypothetical protein